MKFHDGLIDGVQIKSLARYHDSRGWLCELFRDDDVAPEFQPVMAYQSMTMPGVARGPHEHLEQADYFCFIGPSTAIEEMTHRLDFRRQLFRSTPYRRRP